MVAVWPLVQASEFLQNRLVTQILEKKTSRLHRAWPVAAVGFITLIGAAGFRSVPSVLLDPLHEEFGWSHATISAAVSINLLLYGLISPFAAALMDRLGLRRVVSGALLLIALGSGLTIFMNSSWQLLLCWGLLVGVGTGSMSMAFVATITGRWFVHRRGTRDRDPDRRWSYRAADLPAADRFSCGRIWVACSGPGCGWCGASGDSAGTGVHAGLPE